MDARDVIANYLRGAKQFSPTTETNMALEIIHALASANIDLIHRDENHGPTLERAAAVGHLQALKSGNEHRKTSRLGLSRGAYPHEIGKEVEQAIRAMGEKK